MLNYEKHRPDYVPFDKRTADKSTKYLLTTLRLQKLSRLFDPKDQNWSSFDSLKRAAEKHFKVTFTPQEKNKSFAVWELVTFFTPYWESETNAEY